MNVEIKEFKETGVMFIRRTGGYQTSAPTAWKELMEYVDEQELENENSLVIGICHDDPADTPEKDIRYDACISVDTEKKGTEEIKYKTIPNGTYAVYTHKGSYDNIEHSFDDLYKKWLPTSNKELRDGPCMEIYLNCPQTAKTEDLRTELWIPVK